MVSIQERFLIKSRLQWRAQGKKLKRKAQKYIKNVINEVQKTILASIWKVYTLFDEPNEVVEEENIYREAGHRRNESPYTF